MSAGLNFCPSCGSPLSDAPRFCHSCGLKLMRTAAPNVSGPNTSDGLFRRYWRRSVKGRIFYGAWVLLNITNGVNLIASSSAPEDRFRGVCEWEGVNCPPSAEEQAMQSLFNLILWNTLFWAFRYFYKRRQASSSR